MNIPPERLLAEIDELLRTAPVYSGMRAATPEDFEWRGRLVAVMRAISTPMGVNAATLAPRLDTMGAEVVRGQLVALLHEARYAQVLQLPTPTSLQVGAKAPFDYFDEIRKIISTGTYHPLFVDPYLDAAFVSRYMPHVKAGVSVRLLGSKDIAALASASTMYTTQTSLAIEVRKVGSPLHDRFVFIDGKSCYQSGASFKDGGVKAPATIVQIVDAFAAVQSTYEALWASGTA